MAFPLLQFQPHQQGGDVGFADARDAAGLPQGAGLNGRELFPGFVGKSADAGVVEIGRQLALALAFHLIEQLREQVAAQESRAEETATPEEASLAIQSLEPLTVPIQQPPIQQPLTVELLGSDQALAPVRPIPQLTGVVKGPGDSSSAIFQLGQGSVSAGIGEAIGSSGWVLSEVTDSGAVISRNGQRQTLSVGGLF